MRIYIVINVKVAEESLHHVMQRGIEQLNNSLVGSCGIAANSNSSDVSSNSSSSSSSP
jgi:hypothetical protein